jgi:hypothetical protein
VTLQMEQKQRTYRKQNNLLNNCSDHDVGNYKDNAIVSLISFEYVFSIIHAMV